MGNNGLKTIIMIAEKGESGRVTGNIVIDLNDQVNDGHPQ
jgi:hypothetical protein